MILGGNELLSTFMGYEWQYHQEWNRLMPVVERIEEIVEESEEFGSLSFYMISLAMITVTDKNNKLLLKINYDASRKDRLKKNWKACVEFVDWWNQNKNK